MISGSRGRMAARCRRPSPAVIRRARELGVAHVIQGINAKLPAFRTLLGEIGLGPEQACVIGDDLPDLPLVRNAGLGVAVANACAPLRQAAHHVTTRPGGQGAVREMIEMLLTAQRRWHALIERLNGERL